MTKETKIERVLRELSDMREFYKKIPKIKESDKDYSSDKKGERKERLTYNYLSQFFVFRGKINRVKFSYG